MSEEIGFKGASGGGWGHMYSGEFKSLRWCDKPTSVIFLRLLRVRSSFMKVNYATGGIGSKAYTQLSVPQYE